MTEIPIAFATSLRCHLGAVSSLFGATPEQGDRVSPLSDRGAYTREFMVWCRGAGKCL